MAPAGRREARNAGDARRRPRRDLAARARGRLRVAVRDDLVALETDGKIVLSAPGSGRRLSLPAVVRPLLSLCDGTRDVGALVLALAADHGLGLEEKALCAVLARLCEAGLAVDLAAVRVRTLPSARFDCSGCGHCCRNFAVGPLEDDFVARMAALDLSVTGIAGPYVDELTGKDGRTVRYLTARDGRCVFLTAEDRCALHQHFGAAAKPVGCRLFPLVARWSAGELRLAVNPECQGTRHAAAAEDATPVAAQARLAIALAGPPPGSVAVPAAADATAAPAAARAALADELLEELVGRAAPPIEEALATMTALALAALDAEEAAAAAAARGTRAGAEAGVAPLWVLFAEALTRRPPFARQDQDERLARGGAVRARLEREGWALPLPALSAVAERLWRESLAHPLFVHDPVTEHGLGRTMGLLLCAHAALKASLPATSAAGPGAMPLAHAVDLATSDVAEALRYMDHDAARASGSAAALRALAARLGVAVSAAR